MSSYSILQIFDVNIRKVESGSSDNSAKFIGIVIWGGFFRSYSPMMVGVAKKQLVGANGIAMIQWNIAHSLIFTNFGTVFTSSKKSKQLVITAGRKYTLVATNVCMAPTASLCFGNLISYN